MSYSPQYDPVDRARTAILTALGLFAVVMVIGAIGYKQFGGPEGSWSDAIYITS